MNLNPTAPFYQRIAMKLLALFLVFLILYILQDILIPLLIAALFAVIIEPLNKLLGRVIPSRTISIFISLGLLMLVTAILMYFLYSQIMLVMGKFPIIKNRIFEIQADFQNWVNSKYGISNKKQLLWLDDYMAQGSTYVASTMIALSGLILDIILIPIYIFLISYYQNLLCGGMFELLKKYKSFETLEIMNQSESIMRSFLYGLIIETAIVAILNSVGLYFIGVDQAIMLGVMAAILNIIPYIGGLVGTALPMLVSLTAVDNPSMPLYVLLLMIGVQFIDNNFIQPYVVGSKVNINALFAMLGVLIGGFLWGVAGMFLSIPVLAIMKVFFDRVEELKPLGKILGDGKEMVPLKKLPRLRKLKISKVENNVT